MKKILIIEDDLTQQVAYKLKFKNNYALEFATTGSELLSHLNSSLPNLIILDIMLPGGKNGFDLLSTLKENPKTSYIPVIILTNLGEDQRQIALDCGAIEYFTKTNIDMGQLADVIKKCI